MVTYNQIRTQITNTINDNVTGDISAADMRNVLNLQLDKMKEEDDVLSVSITEEETERTAAVNLLQGNIDAEAATREAADTTENQNRVAGDVALQLNIDSEEQARIAVDDAQALGISENRNDLDTEIEDRIMVAGTLARVHGEDGRWNRSGVDYAEVGEDRALILHHVGGERIYDIPVRGRINGAEGVEDGARWTRALVTGSDAILVGQDRRVVTSASYINMVGDLSRWSRSGYKAAFVGPNRRIVEFSGMESSENGGIIDPVTYQAWSDGTNVYADRQDTGQITQLSTGGGNNTNPRIEADVVVWDSDRLDNGTYEPAAIGGRYYSRPDVADEHPVIPLHWLACFGDSTTAGLNNWPSKLADRGWSIPYMNFGRSGNTATGIASRYWALECSYDSPLIPGDMTEVVVTESATNEGNPVETRAKASGEAHGYVVSDPDADPMSGEFVVLRYDDVTESFSMRRYENGDPIPAGKLYFYTAPIALLLGGGNPPPTDPAAPNFQDAILVLPIGRNSSEDPYLVFEMTKRIVEAHKPLVKRMILIPWVQGQDEIIGTEGYNQRALALSLFKEEWPDNTLDIVPYLQAANDGSPEDLAAIANDVPPPSVMLDNIHFNNTGQFAFADGVIDFSIPKGWKL